MKAKDALIKKELIHITKGQNNAHIHSLTLHGARCCYIVFNKFFHPSVGNYVLVSPKFGTVNENGNFYRKGSYEAMGADNKDRKSVV